MEDTVKQSWINKVNEMASERKFFVGGNWKMNGSKAKVDEILKFMNDASFNAVKTGECPCVFTINQLIKLSFIFLAAVVHLTLSKCVIVSFQQCHF